jgi:hypothetical protein
LILNELYLVVWKHVTTLLYSTKYNVGGGGEAGICVDGGGENGIGGIV